MGTFAAFNNANLKSTDGNRVTAPIPACLLRAALVGSRNCVLLISDFFGILATL